MSIVRHAIANTGVEDWRSIAAETNQLEIREEVERLCEFALRLAAHTPSQSMGVRANE
jgi:hypothetical protein